MAAAARGIGADGACCCKSVHRVEPSIPWLWVRRIALRLTRPAGSGRVQIALHGLRIRRALSTSLGLSIAAAVVSRCRLGQFARRHYWLAPRSDDAVGAGLGWGRALAGLQQLDFGCRRFRPAGRIGGAVGPRDRL